MDDKKISELANITGADVNDANDKLVIVDTSTSESRTITRKELFSGVAGNITLSGTVDGRDVAADGSKLDGIETNADVTDTTNVTAAGALMDSELTSEASVKALDQGVATTDSPDFAGLTVDTDTLYVNSTSNRVGIGTSSPNGNSVEIAHASSPQILLTDNGGGQAEVASFDGRLILGADRDGTASNPYVSFRYTGLSEAMRIDSNGRVGIGTTNVGEKLVVSRLGGEPSAIPTLDGNTAALFHSGNGTTGSGAALTLLGGTTSNCSLFFADTDDGNIGSIAYRHSPNAMLFRVNNSERMRIDDTGNVGIGTSSPGSRLSVVGLPTSSAGLSAGDIYIDAGTLKIVT